MADDEFIFDLQSDEGVSDISNPLPSSSDLIHLAKGEVVEYTLMTMVKYRIYPNGMRSHPVSKSWFQDKHGTIINKPKPKKMAEVKESKLQEAEEH